MQDIIYDLEGTQFIWDSDKYRKNFFKHKITFEEAATVIINPGTLYFEDKKHSKNEERLIAVGFSKDARFLTVCHCIRGDGMVRLISARRATKSEQMVYDKDGDFI